MPVTSCVLPHGSPENCPSTEKGPQQLVDTNPHGSEAEEKNPARGERRRLARAVRAVCCVRRSAWRAARPAGFHGAGPCMQRRDVAAAAGGAGSASRPAAPDGATADAVPRGAQGVTRPAPRAIYPLAAAATTTTTTTTRLLDAAAAGPAPPAAPRARTLPRGAARRRRAHAVLAVGRGRAGRRAGERARARGPLERAGAPGRGCARRGPEAGGARVGAARDGVVRRGGDDRRGG